MRWKLFSELILKIKKKHKSLAFKEKYVSRENL